MNSYQTPNLFLVGAAKGLVLGSQDDANFTDLTTKGANHRAGLSRDTPEE